MAGVYLSARLKVAHLLRQQGNESPWECAIEEMKTKIYRYNKHIRTESPWRSLPELTNKDGAFCPPSCPAQAWSVGCFLEALTTFNRLMG